MGKVACFRREYATSLSKSVTFGTQNLNFWLLKVELWGAQSSTFAKRENSRKSQNPHFQQLKNSSKIGIFSHSGSSSPKNGQNNGEK